MTDLDQIKQQYREAVAIHSKLTDRAQAYFDLCRPLMNPELIAAVADLELEYLTGRYPNVNTRGNKTSGAGYFKLFKSGEISLVEGQNAKQVKQGDKTILKHLAIIPLELTPEQWAQRNKSTRVVDRIEDAAKVPLNPQDYLDAAIALLDSDSWVDVAAGLIALTGRRPHEIVARGAFSRVTGSQDWVVKFTGQGKKRGEKPVFNIPTLCLPRVVTAALKTIRQESEVQAILSECIAISDDVSAQNAAIDSRTNKRINRVIKREFGSILPQRKGDKVDEETEATGNCKALRAAYAALVTKRDKGDRSISEQLLYAGRALGHVAIENPTDKDLMHLLTTLGYSDFVINGDVPFVNDSESKKSNFKVSANEPIHEWVNQKTTEWNCTQAQVLDRLITFFESAQTTKLENSEDENMGAIADLQNQVSDLAGQVAALTQAFSAMNVAQPQQPTAPAAPKPTATPKQPATNWALATAADLWGEDWNQLNRAAGAAEERIDRAIRAIFAFNDQLLGYPAKEKWAIGNRALRDLTGANGQLIAFRLQTWAGVIAEHHAKHGIMSDYHNRAYHRGVDICGVIRPMIQAIDP